MKKISNIKRFKTLVNGDLSLFQNAVQLAPEDFKINDQKTHLRCCKKVLTEEEKKEDETEKKQNAFESKLHTQNQRSIYCVSFN
jgi:SWI/SNF-related matrix-associated actin-dependent regulator of chromatin subfamily A member 5